MKVCGCRNYMYVYLELSELAVCKVNTMSPSLYCDKPLGLVRQPEPQLNLSPLYSFAATPASSRFVNLFPGGYSNPPSEIKHDQIHHWYWH